MEMLIGCFAGVIATLAMDSLGILTMKMKWIDLKGLKVVPSLLGRWALLYFKAGTDIRLAAPLNNEKKIGLILHYLIGMFLGGIFVLLPAQSLPASVLYGALTNVFPWLLMYPALGFGFFASKLAVQKPILIFSFVNHVVYGLTLGLAYSFILYTLG